MKPSLLLGEETHRSLADLLQKHRHIVVSGLSNETAKALLLSHILSFGSAPTVFVSEDKGGEKSFEQWFTFFDQEVYSLSSAEEEKGVQPEALRTFLRFMQNKEGVFLCPRRAWDTPFPLFQELEKKKIILKKNKKKSFVSFIEELLENGYAHSDELHLAPGEYRRVGDTLDIFPVQSEHPYRLLFDADRIDRVLERSDPSQTVEVHEDLSIFPVVFTKKSPLVQQLSSETLLVLDDQDDIDPPVGIRTLQYSAFPEGKKHEVHLRYLSVIKFYTLPDLINDLRDKLQQQWALVMVSKRIPELKEIFTEERIPFSEGKRDAHAITLFPSKEDALLPHSVQNPDLQCALITDREIFSLRKSIKQRGVQKLALEFITSLTPGDFVVHMDHGIGRFEQMARKVFDETIREYLELTYAEGDKLFVPVDQADKLSKFVSEEGVEPHLTRLGMSDWKKVTERMKKETQKIAKELLALYAKRADAKGFSYPEDTRELKTFEESFLYQETPGQTQAVKDIKRDMEDDHPMDRLICGDVGFGKTEVAMRAAFKAVQAGKQVAVIAPITILADQHYHTFLDRMEPFSTHIEMLSRFRKPREQKEIIERLRKGEVDIVIGTHRLLQPDVKFLNLGLVIVDEEQRFGVKQKERFKEMRSSVDILTLTATPIPRTLNLGLHKLRDISTITTPPPGRLPIITEVRKYSDNLIREAILKERKRNGQCFILHNRVETINAFANKLRSLVPEVSFIVGHGQLKSEELEERVLQFKNGNIDVLVSSTIIENGIDLPRANTLVVNEAEKFGLAQLYQLRGRVGRSKVQAYAYFLYHSQRLKDDAKKRLRAIVEACELGSGFQVAMRDLEIRGAGEILGAEQHGTMQTVGVSHYLRILKNAIQELKAGKKGVTEEEENIEILLPIEAFLPTFYIPDEGERISMYQKLAGCTEEGLLDEFRSDLKEEYGDFPRQVENLFAVLALKMVCRRAGVLRVKYEEAGDIKEVTLSLSPRVTAKEIMQILKVNPRWRISGSTLRIAVEELERAAGSKNWVTHLTRDVEALTRKGREKGV